MKHIFTLLATIFAISGNWSCKSKDTLQNETISIHQRSESLWERVQRTDFSLYDSIRVCTIDVDTAGEHIRPQYIFTRFRRGEIADTSKQTTTQCDTTLSEKTASADAPRQSRMIFPIGQQIFFYSCVVLVVVVVFSYKKPQ